MVQCVVHLHFAMCDPFLCCVLGCQSAVWQNVAVHPALLGDALEAASRGAGLSEVCFSD